MLTNVEFMQWCKKLGLPEPSIELIKRIRESEPSRAVGGGTGNMVGAYPSRKMGRTLQFESHKVELPGLYLKEFDDKVIEIYDQPPALKIAFKSIKEKTIGLFHTPDYFVLYEDKAGWEEWKTEEELRKLSLKQPNRYVFIDGKWHCPPGEDYAKRFGLQYWVKSSNEINWELQRNIIFLEDYLVDNKTEQPNEVVKSVCEYVHSKPGILLIDLINNSGVDSDSIYYLIARGHIYVDLENEVLGEPEFTHVFIDKQSFMAFKSMTYHKKIPISAGLTFEISSGKKVIWDGRPWIIVNLGEENISLLSDKDIIEIPKDHFFNMIGQKIIKDSEEDITQKTYSDLFSKLVDASEQELKEANYRYNLIQPVLNGCKPKAIGKTEITLRTINNWVRNYKLAEEQYGSGFIGLIPCINKRGNRNVRLPDETLKVVDEFLDANENATNQSYKALYGKLCNQFKDSGTILPSLKSFYKMINSRPKYKRILKTQGSRIAYEQDTFYWELDMTTPRHGERPFEICHIDHTEIDLQMVHSKTNKKMGKCWLTILMDAFTRRVLAFYITYDSPSYCSDMMALRECVRRFNRLPQIIITDNGRDFKSTFFESLLALYGITHKIRPPHKARFGSVGERLFGTVMTQLIHNLQGNTKIMKNARQVTKSVNPINHAVWTLPDLYKLLSKYFYEFYDTSEHFSLGESPRNAFERSSAISGKRPFRYIPYNEEFKIMTLPKAKYNNGLLKVDPQRGVKVNYIYYHNDILNKSDIAGTYVPVRYDPWNIGIVYCYVRNRWFLCLSQYYPLLKNKSENEIEIASHELLEQKRKCSKNVNITAKELADFLAGAEKTEELLNQRLCDEEMKPQLTVINGNASMYSEEKSVKEFAGDYDLNSNISFDINEEW